MKDALPYVLLTLPGVIIISLLLLSDQTPAAISSCKTACGERGMASYSPKNGCLCSAPDGGPR